MSHHATHEVHENSRAAHAIEEVKLSLRADQIVAWIRAHGPHTDRQVMQAMGFQDMNCVRPRITEAIEACQLLDIGNVRCSVTGRRVRRVDVPRQQQALPL